MSHPFTIPSRHGIEVYPNQDDAIVLRSIDHGESAGGEHYLVVEVEDVPRLSRHLREVARIIRERHLGEEN